MNSKIVSKDLIDFNFLKRFFDSNILFEANFMVDPINLNINLHDLQTLLICPNE